jgi:hypothetical protein
MAPPTCESVAAISGSDVGLKRLLLALALGLTGCGASAGSESGYIAHGTANSWYLFIQAQNN